MGGKWEEMSSSSDLTDHLATFCGHHQPPTSESSVSKWMWANSDLKSHKFQPPWRVRWFQVCSKLLKRLFWLEVKSHWSVDNILTHSSQTIILAHGSLKVEPGRCCPLEETTRPSLQRNCQLEVFKRWEPTKRLNIFKSFSPRPCWCLRGAKSICCAEHFIPTVAQLQSAPPHRTFHFSAQWTTHRELRSTIGLRCTVTDTHVFSPYCLLSPVGCILSSTDFCRPWRKQSTAESVL